MQAAHSATGTRVIRTTRHIRAGLEKKLFATAGNSASFAKTLDEIAKSLGGTEALAKRNFAAPR